jgi:hypothetical protein
MHIEVVIPHGLCNSSSVYFVLTTKGDVAELLPWVADGT